MPKVVSLIKLSYLFLNLTPCVPLSFEGEGDKFSERGPGPLSIITPPSLQ